jgi:hypothetical protein
MGPGASWEPFELTKEEYEDALAVRSLGDGRRNSKSRSGPTAANRDDADENVMLLVKRCRLTRGCGRR